MAEYDHVDPRTDAEVARDEDAEDLAAADAVMAEIIAGAKGKKAPDAKNKARKTTEPTPSSLKTK